MGEIEDLRRRVQELESQLDAAARPAAPKGPQRSFTPPLLRAARVALRATDERLRAVVAHAPIVLFAFDREGILTLQDGKGSEAVGLAPGERVGQSVFELYSPLPGADDAIRRALAGEFVRWDGVTRNVALEVTLVPERDETGVVTGVTGVAVNVTGRVLGQQALRASEERYRRIVESTSEGVFTCDLEGRFTFVNQRFAIMVGRSRDALQGEPVHGILDPEEHQRMAEHMGRLLQGGSEACEARFLLPGGEVVWARLNCVALRGDDGRVEGILALAGDITEQRRVAAALEQTEAQLRQAQKMEAVGSLAGGIAHDFNNLLSVILTYATFAMEELPPEQPLRADLGEIEKAAKKAAELTRQLLAFSRRQILEPQVLDLNASLRGLDRMLRRILGEDIELTLLVDRKVGRIMADPGQIEQVVLNLVVNARDAMPAGGYLTLETSDVVLDEAKVALLEGLKPGRHVMLAITDTGTGMDAPTRERVFEPFFTTKGQGKGTGLGLSTVYGIVRQSGGHISVASTPGEGTVFRLYFPRTSASEHTTGPIPLIATSLRGTETILLVEDEPAVRAVTLTILRRQGYTVLEAQGGGDALLLSEQYKGTIHLLLTDVVMPRMNGHVLASRLLAMRPGLRVLYASGYTDDAIVQHGVLEPGIEFLQKPITPELLARRVREVLGPASPEPPVEGGSAAMR